MIVFIRNWIAKRKLNKLMKGESIYVNGKKIGTVVHVSLVNKQKKRMGVVLALLFIACAANAWWLKTYFSPYDDIEKQWLWVLDQAQQEVWISCYGVSDLPITAKLQQLAQRGVKVTVCIDKSQSAGNYCTMDVLVSSGVRVVVKKTSYLEHNKMCSVDNRFGIIGSWNLGNNANKQDNSVVVFDCKTWAVQVTSACVRIYNRDKGE